MTTSASLPGVPAELGNRLVARLVDGLAVTLAVVPLIVVGVVPDAGMTGALTIAALGFVYAAVLDATGGTLGKRLLRMEVVGPRGRRPGLGAGTTRNVWLLTSALPGLLGQTFALALIVVLAISVARHPIDLGWHDRLAGTAVRRDA